MVYFHCFLDYHDSHLDEFAGKIFDDIHFTCINFFSYASVQELAACGGFHIKSDGHPFHPLLIYSGILHIDYLLISMPRMSLILGEVHITGHNRAQKSPVR